MENPMKLRLLAIATFILLHNLYLTTADLNSDAQALFKFASTVPHLRKLNWNSTIPICTSWVGIKCNDEGTRVIAIHLPGVGLYGQIPPNSIGKLDALRILSLRSNSLSGTLPSDIPSIPSLQSLYLQHNNFSGDIPLPLSPQISVLDLSFNSFSGNIPQTIKNLTRLTSLNLQFNSFSGALPDLNLTRLRLFNISHNILNGSIPFSLQKFPVSSFEGNSFLCGPPLSQCSSLTSSPSPSPNYLPSIPFHSMRHKKLSTGAIVGIAVGGFFLLLLLAFFLFCCLKKKNEDSVGALKVQAVTAGKNEKSDDFGSGVQASEKNKLVFFDGSAYNFDLEDLLRASAEVLGKGSYGTAYKAILDEETTVVVKRIREVGVPKKEFEQHMEFVGRLGRHPNIVPLCAYYYSKDEKLLVHEYMHTGSLSSLLHGNRGIGRTPLDWDSRVKISLEAAKGIAHIHSEGGAKFTHGNIKSSNILLTRDLDGCVSDLGLAPLMNFLPAKSRCIGYYAPEVIETRKFTQKSDVYSFGVLLLEILTGKAPLPSSGQDEVVDLPRWVRSVVREEWTAEVFDVELMKQPHVEEEMVQMLQIGLACVTRVPDMRPSMEEVVKMIIDLRPSDSSENRPSSEDNRSNVVTP
ncbi:probable inactive receptor kinase At5g58300 [Cynara cardunculus var. scolymus]|uniref:Leucine-rich repeat-containing protein n=1 Tax=Cynara cardunculus var. scolymus TaxID=59895 RepID=A0A103YDI0_CYNCS|nr:probable inactive receptor kinase At5g58300 [Cynara cardunculus var. scolymus]XP_024970019.1 probable inactive receptor kinase At5g58300 [Cynara cardunculus var. scolymus]KVI07088.1 Leucine-rich repeat-containing protein [Cynara cardunculus var. scolymus]